MRSGGAHLTANAPAIPPPGAVAEANAGAQGRLNGKGSGSPPAGHAMMRSASKYATPGAGSGNDPGSPPMTGSAHRLGGEDLPVAYDDAPLRRFHARVVAASFGGVFSDGFGLGIIGLVLSLAASDLRLTPTGLGLLGGAALGGLFGGALLGGVVVDRVGRRPVFAYNMLFLCVLSALQFLVTTVAELFVLRLAIGFLLGTDYVVSKALLTT